ncbi:MAG: hypothetical protein AAGP08_01570 [Pseudomonadota bacterium]
MMRPIVLLSAMALGGCAYEQQAMNAELQARVSGTIDTRAFSASPERYSSNEILLDLPTLRMALYALRLSDNYKALGDRAARNRDLAGAAIIALAAAAALETAASVGTEEVVKALAAGAVVDEAVKFVRPEGAAEAFYDASASMACMSAQIAKFFAVSPEAVNIYGNYVSLWYIRRVELRLRADLQRDIPSLDSLLDRFGKVFSRTQVAALTSGGPEKATGPDIEMLKTALASCEKPKKPAEAAPAPAPAEMEAKPKTTGKEGEIKVELE